MTDFPHMSTQTSTAPGEEVAAIILAAGYSERMGRFKPLLPLGGTSAIACAVNAFHGTGISALSVITGHNADQLATELDRLNVRHLHNPAYASGMYSSVVAGIAALPPTTDACLILPADIPLIRPGTIGRILGQREQHRSALVYPTFNGKRGHPPLIGRELFAEILGSNGEGGLKAVLERHEDESEDVAVFDEAILLDMDVREDYECLRALADRRDIPTQAECEAILSACHVAEKVVRHSRQVARVAVALTRALSRNGVAIDDKLVLAGALLHDVARAQPHHAEAGAALANEIGFPKVASIVACHMDISLAGSTPDAAIVYLADKLVQEDRIIPLEARFHPTFERFRDNPDALRGAHRRYENACAIATTIERIVEMPLSDILAALTAE